MKYVSIDIETSGLDPNRNQVLEIGAVYDNGDPILDNLPTLRLVLLHEQITFTPGAATMHKDLIKEIHDALEQRRKGQDVNGNPPWDKVVVYVRPEEAVDYFLRWLIHWDALTDSKKIIAAGKNLASFDIPFLKRLPMGEMLCFKHRILDPVTLYLRAEDKEPPNMETCCERAGIELEGFHTAVADAMTVVKLLRWASPALSNSMRWARS